MTTTRDRIASKIRIEGKCWVWIGAKHPSGYGCLWNGRRPEQAHRVAYREYRGSIPRNKEIDHLCRNRACVNPKHLELVTHRENVLRGVAPPGNNARKLFCARGHEFTPENTYIFARDGSRHCRKCGAANARRYKRARREEALGLHE